MNERIKSVLKGCAIAVCVPIFGFVFFYFKEFSDGNFFDFIRMSYHRGILAPILSVSLVPNLIVFFWFYRRENDNASNGVILGSLLWGIVVFILKAPTIF